MSAEDWICLNCKNQNFESETSCIVCGAKKTVKPATPKTARKPKAEPVPVTKHKPVYKASGGLSSSSEEKSKKVDFVFALMVVIGIGIYFAHSYKKQQKEKDLAYPELLSTSSNNSKKITHSYSENSLSSNNDYPIKETVNTESTPSSSCSQRFYIGTIKVNLRNSELKKTGRELKFNTEVCKLSQKSYKKFGAYWYEVKAGNQIGWVNPNYLLIKPERTGFTKGFNTNDSDTIKAEIAKSNKENR